MGMTAIGALVLQGNASFLTMAAQRMFAGATGYTLLAVPFFILAGSLMNTGGITVRIFRFAQAISGHWWGGLGQVNVIVSIIFAGMSGTAIADAAGIGVVEIKAMNDAGYDPTFSATVTAVSSTIGPVIPPSVPMVIYASITGASVGALFLAGILPGLLMGLSMCVVVYSVAKKRNYPRCERATFKEFLLTVRDGIPVLICPLILMGGLLSGFFTPTEVGVIACLYALVLGVFIYREIKIRDLPGLLWTAARQSANLMFIIGVASFFAWFLNFMRIPQQVIISVTTLISSPAILMMLMLLIYLVLGCFMEGTAIMYITMPIFAPLVTRMNVDMVQFGVVTVLALMIGMITPPVGVCLYAVSDISGVKLGRLSREAIPYIVALIVVLILIAYIPPISLAVPRLLGYLRAGM
jgi:tripartite ATP-independent transporter DctM subunit